MSIPTCDVSANDQFDSLFDRFVINLKRRPERLQGFVEQNKPSRIAFNRFEVIDGAQIDGDDIYDHIVMKGA